MSTYLPYEANRVRLDEILRKAEARRAARAVAVRPARDRHDSRHDDSHR
jgi:hypothetical protein